MRKLRVMLGALIAVAALAYGGATAYFYVKQDGLIFPQRINTVNPEMVGVQPARLELPDGGTLRGVEHIPDAPVETLVLLFGGNAHDVGGFANFWATDILPAGDSTTAVGAMAYRGYGTFMTPKSDGEPSEVQLHTDARTIYDAYASRLKPKRVVLVGYSLGTAFASRLAYDLQQAGTPVASLILVTPFASMREVGQMAYPWLPVGPLLKHPLDTASFFGQLTVPTTILYTPTDGLLPENQPFRLQEIKPDVTLVRIENTTHGDILNRPEVPAILKQAAGLK